MGDAFPFLFDTVQTRGTTFALESVIIKLVVIVGPLSQLTDLNLAPGAF